jgi:hypothetical protein
MPVNPLKIIRMRSKIKETPFKRWKTIGDVSVKFLLDGKLMVDKPWEEGAIKVIRKAQYIFMQSVILYYFLK